MNVPVLAAHPINSFAVRVGLRLGFVQCRLANAVHLLDPFAFFFGFLLRHFARPAHFFFDLFVRLVGVAVFVEQLAVFLRARVGLLEKPFVIVLVPFFFRVFLPALLLFDGLG